MASTIKLKNSTTKGNTPSSLEQGEVAINVNDGNLFYGDGSSVLQNFTFNHVTASGDISASGTITAAAAVLTTADVNGGTIDGITSLTAGGDLDIGSHNFRAATLQADTLSTGRVIIAGSQGVLTTDSDFSFATDTLTITKIANVNSISHVTASNNISASGNVIANNFIGTNIQLVSHAWFSNYASADWGLDLLTNGDDNFGWADRVWDHAIDKTDIPSSGTINSTGTFTHAHFNKGFRVNHNITDIELIGVLRPNSSVNELNYYIYKGTPFNGTTDSTITFLASASSATAVTSRPNDIYITGSTGLQANKGDYIFVFANADLGSGNMKGSYTLTAKTRE